MNSRESWDEDQTFDVLIGGNIERISGRISVNSYLLAGKENGDWRIHLNGRPEKHQILQLWGLEKPARVVTMPKHALVKSSWDAKSHCVVLDFSLRSGAVAAVVGF